MPGGRGKHLPKETQINKPISRFIRLCTSAQHPSQHACVVFGRVFISSPRYVDTTHTLPQSPNPRSKTLTETTRQTQRLGLR